jgi:TonB family protein
VAPTIKDSPGLSTENKSGLSPRSNPVCLEVGVTLRSLPGESGGSSQPVREECRTVIVFDNGAVLRSSGNLPAGQKITLSNAAGREVVCRVASGHNLPSIKGYTEVEFLEPVSDFWSIHTDTAPVSGSVPPPSLSASRPAAAPPPPPTRATPSLDSPSTSSISLGKGPSFEDVPDLGTPSTTAATREAKPAPAKPAPNTAGKGASDYSHSEIADPTSLANWNSPASGLRAEVQAIPLAGEEMPRPTRASAPTHDFLSQGLMAYEKPGSSGGALEGRAPLLLGLAALVLAGVGAVVFVMHRNAGPEPAAKKSVSSPSSAASAPAAPPADQPLEQAAREAGDAAVRAPAPAPPAAVEQDLPLSSFTPLPAVVKGPATADANAEPRNESRNTKRLEKNTAAAKQPEPAAARVPAMPNLKMATPSAPAQNSANAGDTSAPAAEIAAEESTGAVPSANLLTAAGRTSAPPPAPAAAFPSANSPAPPAAFKTMRAAQLISSARPLYPAAAKETSVQGTVTVSASIDATGKVVSTTAVSGPIMLRHAAADSVKLWKYSPALVDGKPAATEVTVNVEFHLN